VNKVRAQRNRTVTLSRTEKERYEKILTVVSGPVDKSDLVDKIVNGDILEALEFLPNGFVDLLILDPPYNLNKTFTSITFRKKSITKYAQWFEEVLVKLLPVLKDTASRLRSISFWKNS